jgi:type IV pilus assembly protein PilM
VITLGSPVIGVDIGSHSIKAVQLVRSRAGMRVAAAMLLQRDQPGPITAELFQQLASALQRQGFRGWRIAIACPPERLLTHLLELPPGLKGEPLAKLARSELRRLARLENDHFEYALKTLPSSARAGTGVSTLAVAATRDATEQLATMAAQAGLELVSVDTHACALARVARSTNTTGLMILVDLGDASAMITLCSNGQLLYQRSVHDGGLGELRKTVCGKLHLDDNEARSALREIGVSTTAGGSLSPKEIQLRTLIVEHLDLICREIQTSASFAAHRYPDQPIAGVFISGGGAQLPGVHKELADKLGMPVTDLEPARASITDPLATAHPVGSQLVVATGLALAAAETDSVNLLSKVQRDRSRIAHNTRRWGTVGAIYALAIGAAWAGVATLGGRAQVTLEADLARDAEVQRHINTAIAEIRTVLVPSSAALDTHARVLSRPQCHVLLAGLSRAVSADVSMREVRLERAGGTEPAATELVRMNLVLSGSAASQQSVSALSSALQAMNVFESVKLVRTGREPDAGSDEVQFELLCGLIDTEVQR